MRRRQHQQHAHQQQRVNTNSIGINLVTAGTSLNAMASDSLVQNNGTGISAAASTSIKIAG